MYVQRSHNSANLPLRLDGMPDRQHCYIDTLLLHRDLRLFPLADGMSGK